jgi:hypothetical protein
MKKLLFVMCLVLLIFGISACVNNQNVNEEDMEKEFASESVENEENKTDDQAENGTTQVGVTMDDLKKLETQIQKFESEDLPIFSQ